MSNDSNNDIPKMSFGETEELAARLSEAGRSGLPLPSGLRAAAQEASSRRLARALRSIAKAVEAGQSLDEILSSSDRRLSGHVGGLVAAAARTDRFGEALSDLVEHHRSVRQLRRLVVSALAYPLIVLAITFLLIGLATLMIIPHFAEIYLEFELALPNPTIMLIAWSETGFPVVAGIVGFLVLAALAIRIFGGRAVWERFFSTIPIFGPMAHWSGVAEWSRLMSILMEQNVPLPEALKMAGTGSSNANLQQVSRSLSALSQQGMSLSQLVDSTYRLPRLLVPLVAWGEQTGNLGEALRTASDFYVERVRLRSTMFRSTLPPLLFVLIGLATAWMVASLMMPLVTLIQALS